MEVREQRVVDAVGNARIGNRRVVADDRLQPHASAGGHHRARRHTGRHFAQCRLVEITHRHRIEQFLFGRLELQVRTRRCVRRDRAREVAPCVVLRILVADPNENLRVRVDDVERLHERFLADLPVARHHLRDVRLDVTLLRLPHREVLRQVAEEFRQRFGFEIHVDEYPAAPRVAQHRRSNSKFFLSMCGKSHSDVTERDEPSRFQLKPWNGQMKLEACPSASHKRRPRCRHTLWCARNPCCVRTTMIE